MLIKTNVNKTLKGHKLLLVTPWPVPAGFAEGLKSEFPDLEVVIHLQNWDGKALPLEVLPPEMWKNVTILLTFSTLPKPEEASTLQYVQLMSAGVNHLLDNPTFKDTNVKFCSANGVHG
jgi:hypothetical protein